MEKIDKPRIAFKCIGEAGQPSCDFPEVFPNDFPFNLQSHLEAITEQKQHIPPQSPQLTYVDILTQQTLLSVGEFSEVRIHFPRGTQDKVQEILSRPQLEVSIFSKAARLLSSVVVSTDFELREEFRTAFLHSNFQVVLVSKIAPTIDIESGRTFDHWDVHYANITGRLSVEAITAGTLSGAFEVSKKNFLLKFVIKGDRLVNYQFFGEELVDNDVSYSFFSLDNEGTCLRQQEYYFGQLKNHRPHGFSNCEKLFSDSFYDGKFANGRVQQAVAPDEFVMGSTEFTGIYENVEDISIEPAELQIELVTAHPNKIEGTITHSQDINLATFYHEDGNATSGYFSKLLYDGFREGIIKDRFGEVIVKSNEFENIAKAYSCLVEVWVGNGEIPSAFGEFVRNAVKICNKLTFPYEEDYEPPREIHRLDEETFKELVRNLSMQEQPKIVHAILLPSCKTSHGQLGALAQKVSQNGSLIISDFCSFNGTSQKPSVELGPKTTIITPVSANKLRVQFNLLQTEVQLHQLEKGLLISISTPKKIVQATLFKGKVLTTKTTAKKK